VLQGRWQDLRQRLLQREVITVLRHPPIQFDEVLKIHFTTLPPFGPPDGGGLFFPAGQVRYELKKVIPGLLHSSRFR
jgi:hypothetical protein